MRDIAAAADLSPANLYNYFKGKHELLFFCQDNSLDRMLAALRSARSAKVSAAEKLRMVIESHLRCVLDEVEGSAAHLLTSQLPSRFQRPLVAETRSLRGRRSPIDPCRGSIGGIHPVRRRPCHARDSRRFELERALVQSRRRSDGRANRRRVRTFSDSRIDGEATGFSETNVPIRNVPHAVSNRIPRAIQSKRQPINYFWRSSNVSLVPVSSIFPAESRKSARITISLNGEKTDVSFAPYKTLLEVLREDLALHWHKARLRIGRVRRLRRAGERQAGAVVPDAGARMRRRGRDDRRRTGMRRPVASLARCVCRSRRRAMWLLHAGNSADGESAAGKQSRIQRAIEIREALSGILCRCTGYLQIFEAVESAVLKIAAAKKTESLA